MELDENTLPEQIKKELHRYINAPQRGAFIKGLLYEIQQKNPYTGKEKQSYCNKTTFQISFFNAFKRGRDLKVKYNYNNQTTIKF
jgi:hypothetical protein